VAGITLPNPASIGLHASLGFEPIGVLRDIGWKENGWRDVGYWQLYLQSRGDGPPDPPRLPRPAA
jgi:phosphinothricin acetyltransferase